MNPITSMSQEIVRLRGQLNSRLVPIDVTVTANDPLLLETVDGTELEGAIAIGVPLRAGTRAVAFIGDGRIWVQGQVLEGDLAPGELSDEMAGRLENQDMVMEQTADRLLDVEIQGGETFALADRAAAEALLAWEHAEAASIQLASLSQETANLWTEVARVTGYADDAATAAGNAHNDAVQAAADAAAAQAAAAAAVKNSVVQYATGTSETVAPTTGWSTDSPVRTAGTFIWMRSVITYGNDSTSTTNPVILTGNAGADGAKGDKGDKGEDGADGIASYTWVKYASTPSTGMSDDPTGKDYIGLAYNRTTATESTSYTDYTWSQIRGADGEAVQGPPGPAGETRYTWIKYGTSSAGDGMSDSPVGKTYIGLAYNKSTATESTTPGDYQWALFQGPQGVQGPQGSIGIPGPAGADGADGAPGPAVYTWLKYADTPTSGMSDLPAGKAFMGLAYNKLTATESSNYADYSWSLIKGADGVAGPAGTDGTTLYTWIKYGTSSTGAGISDDPAGKNYIGVAYNKTTASESSNPTDYVWSLIQGAQGNAGADGTDGIGISGVEVRYQSHTNGTTAPVGTWTSTVPAVPQGHYLWTRTVTAYSDSTTSTSYSVGSAGINGTNGTPGAPGTDGLPSYLHVAYANNSTGTLNFSTSDPSGKSYMGTYTDFAQADSTNPALYDWVLIKGADGSNGSNGTNGIDGTDGTDGTNGIGIASSVVTWQINATSGTVAPTGTWLTSIPAVPEGQFLWTRTVLTFTDGASTISYNVAKQGVGVSGTSVTYQTSTSGTSAPSGAWVTTVPTVAPGSFLWTRTIVSYGNGTSTTAYSVSRAGVNGANGTPGANGTDGTNGIDGTNGSDGRTSYLHVAYSNNATGSSGFSTTDPSGRTYMGTYTDFTEADSSTPSKYDWVLIKGADGTNGANGKGISSSVVTWQASATSGTSAPTGAWLTSIPSVPEGQWLWTRTVLTFTDGATTTTYSVAKQGIGITNTSVTYQTHVNGTTAPTGTWSSTIPVVAPGQFLWTRTIIAYGNGTNSTAYSVGSAGTNGSNGTAGAKGADGQTSYLHVAYANNATGTSGFSTTDPSGRTYMGTLTDFTVTDSTNPALYDWVLIKGADGANGSNGAPGKGISSSVVHWQVNPTSGTTAPTGTWLTTIPNTPDGQYLWTRTVINFTDGASTTTYSVAKQGQNGSNGTDGKDGISVTSLVPYFKQQTVGTTPSPAPSGTTIPAGWVTSEPSYVINTSLWRADRVSYSNGGVTWTTMTKVAGYEIAAEAIASANGKNTRNTSTKSPLDSPVASTNLNGRPLAEGDTWWRVNNLTDRVVTGQWAWSGSAWQAETIGTDVIANLDVSKLTATTASMQLATAKKMAADFGAFKVLTADKLAVLSTDGGVYPDPTFLDEGLGALRATNTSGITFVPGTNSMSGTGNMWLTREALDEGKTIPLVKGERYTVRVWGTGLTAVNGRKFAVKDDAGHTIRDASYFDGGMSLLIEPAAENARVQIWRTSGGTASHTITRVEIRQGIGGTLIEDGAITGDKLNVDSAWIGSLLTPEIIADKISGKQITGLSLQGGAFSTAASTDFPRVDIRNGLFTSFMGMRLHASSSTEGAEVKTNTSTYAGKPAGGLFLNSSQVSGSSTEIRLTNDEILGFVNVGGSYGTYFSLSPSKFKIVGADSLDMSVGASYLKLYDNYGELKSPTRFTVWGTTGVVLLAGSASSGSNVTMRPDLAAITLQDDRVFQAASDGTYIKCGMSFVSLTPSTAVIRADTFTFTGSNGAKFASSSGGMTYEGAGHTFTLVGLPSNTNSWSMGGATFAGVTRSMLRYNGGSANMAQTGLAANLHMDGNGRIYFSTSTAKNKVSIQDISADPYLVLNVPVRDWFDKTESEGYANFLSGDTEEEVNPTPLRRIPGVVAEEIEAAGLGQFVTYGLDGEPNGVMYDRLALLLIPVVRDLKAEVDTLKARLAT